MPARKLLLTSALALAALPAMGIEPALQFVITLEGDAQRDVVTYHCEGSEDAFSVSYINANPNFLALVPIAGETLIFANVVSASGARYVAGQYEWWSRGNEATLSDEFAPEGAEPVLCHVRDDTP